MHPCFTRHQPPSPPHRWLLAGLGGVLAIAVTGGLSLSTGVLWLMAPFGASCVLLFSVPHSPLSQPTNVIGGHVLSVAVALVLRLVLPDAWWAAALAVGAVITLMAALRVTHPPAGADPLVVFATDPGFGYLVFPALLGSVCLVVVAGLYHRLTGTPYPLRSD